MTKKEYIDKVLVVMNESRAEGSAVFTGADTAQVDQYIEDTYIDAWRRCAAIVPRGWLKKNYLFLTASEEEPDDGSRSIHVANLENGTGYVLLPPDFYMFYSFKMSGWKKVVYEALEENEQVTSIQGNEYTRGSEIRPVCTLSTMLSGGDNRYVLRYYSLRPLLTEHKVDRDYCLYIPATEALPASDNQMLTGITDRMVEPMAYVHASIVYTLFEKPDTAALLYQKALEMCG